MRKILFSDRYGLTQAVLEERKTMTRRAVSEDVWRRADEYRYRYYEDTLDLLPWKEALIGFSPFKVGEVVAVAQAYWNVSGPIVEDMSGPGWFNKMFVRSDLMPHQIRITNVRIERLQDISDEDCLREGVYNWKNAPDCPDKQRDSKIELYGFDGRWDGFETPRAAFAALIDKVSGRGTWDKNPYVFVYKFELVK